MKKIILFFLLALCLPVSAQTIHWILFVDTSDWQLGDDNKNGKVALEQRFINKVNAALEKKGYRHRSYNYIGANATAAKYKAFVDDFSCSSKDIVVFYYIGHGGRPQNNTGSGASPWPELEFVNSSHNYISLNTIHQCLKSKKPQLTLTIGMCCNVARSTHKAASQFGRRQKIVSRKFAHKLQRLFLNNKGDILVAAAAAGQIAYGGYESDEGEMDFFTGTLCDLMDKYSADDSDNTITWSSLLKELSRATHYNVREGLNEDQTPYYQIHITPL